MGPILNPHEALSWLRRRWQVIAVIAVLGAVAGVIMAMRTDRIYSASAVIQVINPVVDVSGDGGGGPDVTRRLQIIEQRLMSRDALLDLADRYNLFDDAPLNPLEKVAMMRESFSISAIAAAQQGFSRDGSLSALIVSASDDDPQVAAAIANDLADSLVQASSFDRRSDAQQALDFFSAEEARLEAEIAALEAEIATYRSANERLLPAAVTIQREERGRLADRLLQIQQEVSARRSELAGLDPDSPRALTQRRVAELTDEIGQFNLQAAVINERLREIQAILQAAPEIERELVSMTRRMEQYQEQLTTAAERRREAELGARIEVGQQSERFELLERALVPEYPISTSRKKVALAGLIAGIMGGLMLAYLLEWMNPVMRTAQRFERDLQLRPVISIPYEMTPAERRRRQSIWTIGTLTLLCGLIAVGFFLGFS
jgi:tyrosine-protein kinase Etk/Wzc